MKNTAAINVRERKVKAKIDTTINNLLIALFLIRKIVKKEKRIG